MIGRSCTPKSRTLLKITAGGLFALVCFAISPRMSSSARQQSDPTAVPSPTTWTVTLVLPSRVIAGQPATLAALGVDGRLAPDVTVEVAGAKLKTDRTGRASFTAPTSGQIVLAKGSGASAAALIDPVRAMGSQHPVAVDPVVSMKEPFSVCGSGFRGDADANRVRINGENALVLAASPECLSVLPGAKSAPGPAKILITSTILPSGQWTATTTLVSLDAEFPASGLALNEKAQVGVRVRGSDQRLHIVVENQTPGILRFSRGDMQELFTSGGQENIARVEAQAIRSGDFSFDAKLLTAPDDALARAYLEAALPLANEHAQRDITRLVKQLDEHPDRTDDVRRDLDGLLGNTVAGDFRTLLEAARTALS